MANLKQRLHRKNSSGSYDVIYLETLASLVKMDDGTTLTSKISSMDTAINGKAASNHTHSEYAANNHDHTHLYVESGNEMNLDYGFAGGVIYFNYRGASAAITDYIFADGLGHSLGALSDFAKRISSTSDITAGSSSLATGTLYLVYE